MRINSYRLALTRLSAAAWPSRSLSTPNFLARQSCEIRHKMPVSYTSHVRNSAECIDLRSDTVTLPTPEMRQVMANAIMGDDVYGEDPTINALEKRCAELFGKEAAIFVCSGTMGNLLSVMAHCQRGEEIIVGKQSHIHRWEQGNYAQFAGVSAMTVEIQPDGTLALDDIEASIRGGDSHMPTTKLICIENTHNWAGGKPLKREYLASVRALADKHHLKVHMDGARIYNAAAATGISVSEIASYVDSVQMCFSKGLGSPVGSIVAGSKDFINIVRHKRKAVGGGWRQAGVLAAAAMHSLDHAMETVKRDNEHAKRLARGINERTPAKLRDSIHANEDDLTNIIVVALKKPLVPNQVVSFFHERGILVMAFDDHRVRMVTNWGVTDTHIDAVLEVYDEFVNSLLNGESKK